MHFLMRVGIGLVFHGLFYKITKNGKVATASTALLYLLLRKVETASAADVALTPGAEPIAIDQITPIQIDTYYKTKGDSIFIEYPGLKIWFPQIKQEELQQVSDKYIDIEAWLEKARA